MTDSLSQFLNIAIPAGIIIWLGYLVFSKMSIQHPGWFKNMKEWISDRTAPTSEKIDPMHGGSIKYG